MAEPAERRATHEELVGVPAHFVAEIRFRSAVRRHRIRPVTAVGGLSLYESFGRDSRPGIFLALQMPMGRREIQCNRGLNLLSTSLWKLCRKE